MTDQAHDDQVPEHSAHEHPEEEPLIRDKRKIDPETGEARTGEAPPEDSGEPDAVSESPESVADDASELSDEDVSILAEAERDLVAEYRDRAARAEAELKNFRTRVERDRAANRDAVIVEVIRSFLPAIDDLDRAEKHGDLTEGSPLTLVAQKLRAGFAKYGLAKVGTVGEPFDPKLHEALVQLPNPEVTVNTVADVIEPGYALGDRLIRAAKVAVHAPE